MGKYKQFTGSIVALITPFKNGEIDFDTLKKLIEFHIKNWTNAILVVWTTGESPTLSFEEHKELVKQAVKFADKRIPIIAWTGASSTEEAIDLTLAAEKDWADASLQVVPYYNKPTQQGIYQHFATIAKETKLPLILYNIPSRTGVEMKVETFAKLYKEFDNIIWIKEATGKVTNISEIINQTDENVIILSWDDTLTLPMMSVWAKWVISVVNNIIPKEITQMCKLANQWNFTEASKIHKKYWTLFKAMFIETNPIPVKTAMHLMWLLEKLEFRLPLCEMEPENQEKLKNILKNYNLI